MRRLALMTFAVSAVAAFLTATISNRVLWGYWGLGVGSVASEAVRLCSGRWCTIDFHVDGSNQLAGSVVREDSLAASQCVDDCGSNGLVARMPFVPCPGDDLNAGTAILKSVLETPGGGQTERCRVGIWATCRQGNRGYGLLSCTSAPLQDNDRYRYTERLYGLSADGSSAVLSDASRYLEISGLEALNFDVLLFVSITIWSVLGLIFLAKKGSEVRVVD